MRQRLRVMVLAMAACGIASRAAAQPSGFVYTLFDNGPLISAVDGAALAADGTLTHLPGFPISTGGVGLGLGFVNGLAYAPDTRRLFALNGLSHTVIAWTADASTGALTAMPFSPISLPGGLGFPFSIAVNPAGSVLVVGDAAGKVASFAISDTAATPAPGSPYSTGGTLGVFSTTFSRDGAYVYAGLAGATGTSISAFSASQISGALTPLPGSPVNVGAFLFGHQTDTSGRLFAVNSFSGPGTSSGFVFTTPGGVPTPVAGNPFVTPQYYPVTGLLLPAGYYLTTGLVNGTTTEGNVAVFRISGTGAGTVLTTVPGSPFATGGNYSLASVADTSGLVVVTGNGQTRNLTVFRLEPSTGALTRLSVSPTAVNTGTLDGIAFAAVPASPPPPTPTPPFPPTITPIPDQTLAMNTSIAVPFTIGGDLLPTALRVTLSSSNPTLLPVSTSTLTTECDITGACTLRITPEDGRAGTAVITVSVFDGYSATSTSFTVTVTGATTRPTTPDVVLANAVGSGIAVTWTAPSSGAPAYYAVAWGTAPGAANLPLQLVPGTSGRLDLPAAPSGTYFFRVYAVGSVDVSAASRETSVTVTSSASVPGPPMAEQAIAGATSLTAGWNAPTIGGAPTLYELQIGSTLGASDVADLTTADRLLTRSVSAGNYWVQTRAASGGANSAFTTGVQVPVAPPACSAPPAAPVLLPVTTTPGQVTFNWVTAGPAASYLVQIAQSGTPLTTVASVGVGTSAVWISTAASGTSARVTAWNACGTSAFSNQVNFTVP